VRLTMGLIALALAAAAHAPPAAAQDGGDVAEIVVTAERLTEYDPTETPHVALIRRADNLIVEVSVLCDTRDLSQRRAELKTTLRSLIAAAEKDRSIELGLGGEVVGRFDDSMLDAVIRPAQRPDSSVATLVVKTSVGPTDTFDAATGRIKAFVERTPKAGRTEILLSGEWELTLLGPARYRPEVARLVAEDAARMAQLFGPAYGVEVEGLQLPVSWYQSGPLDLALYIPYRLTVRPAGR
jgi:hypothetical protein